MGKIIAVTNQKGGVGKSTTVVNVAAYLGSRGFKVLCVDSDPQGNATTGFGISKKNVLFSTYNVITGQVRIQDAAVETAFDNVSIIPATELLAGAEVELINAENRINRLKMQLLTIKNDYDYIFIDCPPALGMLTINALTAADTMIIPMLAEFYALEGLSQLMDTINIVKKKLNPELEILGVVLTMFNMRTQLSRQVKEETDKYFGNKVFKTVIPRNVRLAEAPSHGQAICDYDKNSKGAKAYESLAKEVIKRA